MEYAVWLIPSGKQNKKLIKIISGLSEKYGTQRFKPHLTLMAEIGNDEKDILRKTSALLKNVVSFDIELKGVSYGTGFFQCIFIKARKSKELMRLNKEAQKIFSTKANYLPHLSLMYGNFPGKSKKEIIKKLDIKFNETFNARNIQVIRVDSPDPKDWHVIKKFILK